MYILIHIGTNGVSWNELCAKKKKQILVHLKNKGYYWSKKAGKYIDDKSVKISGGSGADYQIENLKELK